MAKATEKSGRGCARRECARRERVLRLMIVTEEPDQM
jgi:hypothetical protein